MDQDYTASGFNSFLERSIDNLPQVNLDSPGPVGTQIRYDSSQLSGSQGDSYKMGGISMSAQDSAITINDGQLIVNDTSTNNTINASSGNITYNDNTGNTVIQEGVLPDNTTGIRALDTQQRTVAQLGRFKDNTTAFRILDPLGVGIAQFGQYPDGTVALKVAKSGQEVSTAPNDQLIFNSSQDVFKIVLSGSVSKTIASIAANSTDTTTVAHNLGVVPGILVYATLPSNFPTNYTASLSANVQLPTMAIAGNGTFLFWVAARVDATNLYLDVFNNAAGTSTGPYTFVFKYYILQETAT